MTITSIDAGTSGSHVLLDVPADAIAIAIVRSTVRRLVTFLHDDAESSFLIALTEIVANAVDEHERHGVLQPIRVAITFGTHDAVTVTDVGGGFDQPVRSTADVTAAAGASDDPIPERGRGLALAHAFVDGIRISSTDDGTSVSLPLDGFGIVR